MSTDKLHITETRICPAALCPTAKDGKNYPSRVTFRPADSQSPADWFRWVARRDPVTGEVIERLRRPSTDATTNDLTCPWHNHNANIYRDHCFYRGDDDDGFARAKARVQAVKGFMLDFDSHSCSDMPLSDIISVLESDSFLSAVPCSRVVMSGNGCQIHVPFEIGFPDDEQARKEGIAEFEAGILSAMRYTKEEWRLAPDEKCKDITRLHRHHPSFNTKKMTHHADDANRIEVRLLVERSVSPETVNAFWNYIRQKHRVEIDTTKRSTVFVNRSSGSDTRKAKALEPPCVKTLWDRGSSEGRRNADRFALLCRLHSEGMTEEDALEVMMEFNGRCQPPDDTSTVTTHVRSFYTNPKQCGCTYYRETTQTCPYSEKTMEEAKAACPFLVSIKQAPTHPYYLGTDGTIMRDDYQHNKDGSVTKLVLPVTQSGHMIVTSVIQDTEGKLYGGKIVNGDWTMPFELPASLWANRMKFAERVKGLAGERLVFAGKNVEHISLASELLEPNKELKIATDFGWNADFTEFYAVHCVIDRNGIHAPGERFFRAPHDAVRRLGLQPPASDEETLEVMRHVRSDLMRFNDVDAMQCVLGTVFIAPFTSLLRRRANTTNAVPSIILQGTTGTGKTAMLLLGMSFFGCVRECDLVSFGSTVRFVNDLGYSYKDAIYVIDDLKWGSLHPNVQSQVVGVLQAYVDGHGRNRLGNSSGVWEPTAGKEIRGVVCIAAEDLPSGEASVFGRYMIVNIASAELDADLYSRCLKESRNYSKVMASYLAWYMRKGDNHGGLLAQFDTYRKTFEQDVPRSRVNLIRVCSQLSLNLVGYHMFLLFGREMTVFSDADLKRLLDEHRQRLLELRNQRLVQIAGETPSERFLQMIAGLLSSGKARLDGEGGEFDHQPTIGHREYDDGLGKDILYLSPAISYGMVQRAYADVGEKIPFGQSALGHQLAAQGYLAARDPGHLTVMRRRGGKRARYYAIDLTKFDLIDDEGVGAVGSPPEQPSPQPVASPPEIGDSTDAHKDEEADDDLFEQ